MTDTTPKSYSSDPALYLYTSLTSGSSHIVTATSRLETILKANKIPFKAIDIATDEKARMIWGRRAGKDEGGRVRKIPGLVQMGLVLGDLVEIEDWNEYGELKQHVTIYHDEFTTPSKAAAAKGVPTPTRTPSKPIVTQKENQQPVTPSAESPKAAEAPKPTGGQPTSFTLAMRQASQEAAQKAKEVKKRTTETFVGVGTAEPEKAKEEEKSIVIPPTVTLEPADRTIDTAALAQSPTSTAWKNDWHKKPTTPRHSIEKFESLQSPNSTAWKPTDVNQPITSHRGSSVSTASAECIKQIENDEMILEEDEDALED